MKTFGTARRDGQTREWIIDAQPHVMMRIKRLFGRFGGKTPRQIKVRDTLDVCRDLEWICERWPLEIAQADYLRARAEQHRQRAIDVDNLLMGRATPRPFKLAIPPREYQMVAAEAVLRRGSLLLADDVGLGKAQPLDAKILTPGGWKAFVDLVIGDAVIDPDGGVGHVTGIYPQGEREVYRVTTKDGASAECCAEHLWGIYSANDRARGGAMRVRALHDFMGTLKRKHTHEGWNVSNWFLPIMKPADFLAGADPNLDPYLLGVLLGDGSMSPGRQSIMLTSEDAEIVDRVARSLPDGVRVVRASRIEWRMTKVGSGRNQLRVRLEELGAVGKSSPEKSIPRAAMRASVEYRLELLRGLMDTDGDCSKDGTSIFNTSAPGLRDDVVELVRSLGGIASISTKLRPAYMHRGERRYGKTAYRINVRLPVCPFALTRKVDRWRAPIMARAIESVEPSRMTPTMCIAVSTKRRLYVTDGHLVTHNTASAICALTDPATRPALVVTLTHLPKQWKKEIGRFAPELDVHILKKATPYPLGSGVPGQTDLFNKVPDVIISNYHKLAGWADHLAGLIQTVVFDELQELRSGEGESAKYDAAFAIASQAKYRMGLSATPIYNYGAEFYNVVSALDPEALGTRGEFLTEWTTGGDAKKAKITDPEAFGLFLRDEGIMLRRTRADVGRELPAVTKLTQHVDADLNMLDKVSSSAVDLAKAILAQGGSGFDKMRAGGELDMLIRRETGVAKAPHVASFVRMLVDNGEPVVLFGWHHSVYQMWAEQLEDLGIVFYTGRESPTQKAASIAKFTSGEAKVIVLSLRAGAGLDGLQHVTKTVVIGELDWSPGVLEQCIGRVARDGQKEAVFVYIMLAACGSDPVIADVLGIKNAQLQHAINPGMELVAKLEVDPEHIKKLAAAYLKQMGEKLPTAAAANVASAEAVA